MLDINTTAVGGIVAGSIDTRPVDTVSQNGGHISGYAIHTSLSTELESYVRSLLAAKPVTYVSNLEHTPSGFVLTMSDRHLYLSKTGNIVIDTIHAEAGTQILLIVTDEANNLADVTFNNNQNNTNVSLLVIARNITFGQNVDTAKGVFIASKIFDTGTGGNPLTVTGNVVALGGIVQGRTRTDGDHARPSFLLVFDPKPYLDLMDLFTTKEVQYKVVQ
jgi:hypothetical protein